VTDLDEFRMQVAGRTGGASMNLDIDNLSLLIDGVSDLTDDDGDGLPTAWETRYGLDGDDSSDASGDPDQDTLTNLQEYNLGTNPTKDDTDDDGFKDNVEDGGGVYVGLNQTGTNPSKADSDDDGLKDGSEIPTEEFVDEDQAGTDPNKKDTDEDGVGDGDEIAMGRNPTVPDVITPITPVGGLLATFEEGGGAFESGFFRNAPTNANVLGTEGGDSFWHLLHNGEGSGGNYVSIASTGTAGWASASFTMDLRASGPDNRADGFSVGFLDVATHGASGVTKVNSEEERGLYDNSIGVGFRTFNGTNATVNYSGAQSGDVAYDLPSPGEWGSLQIDLDRGDVEGEVLVSATMFNGPGQTGLASDVFDSYSLTGVTDLDEFRMQVAGRTGGASMNLDIDNLGLTTTGVPEPSSSMVVGLALLAFSARRRR